MVLDRAFSPLDAGWDSLNDMPSHQTLSSELKEEIRTSWKHFRPSSPVDRTEPKFDDPSSDAVDSDNARSEDIMSQYQTFESQTTDLFYDAGLDGFRVPTTEYSPPCVTNSNFNVIGDTPPSVGTIDLDWWNYFDSVEPEDVTNETSPQEVNGKKSYSALHMNGVGSPSTATDSPFWKVPKSASLPNNDW